MALYLVFRGEGSCAQHELQIGMVRECLRHVHPCPVLLLCLGLCGTRRRAGCLVTGCSWSPGECKLEDTAPLRTRLKVGSASGYMVAPSAATSLIFHAHI